MSTKTSYISIARVACISIFFSFSFIDRSISNIFLLATLLLCLIDYRHLINTLKQNKKIIYPIILFCSWIILVGFYHDSPIHELDNYTRLLLLIPLLMIDIDRKYFQILINVSAVAAITHGIFYGYEEERYMGTSSSQITYAYLIITLLILTINNTSILKKNPKNFIFSLFLITGLIWVWTLTGTRGPLISLILCLPLIFYYKKSLLLPILVILLTTSFMYVNNNIYKRFDALYNTITESSKENEDLSYLERKAYLNYGINTIQSSPFIGIGPNKLEGRMAMYFKDNSINITSQDHLHNDYIDISAKFGLPALIFLLLVYFSIYKNALRYNKFIGILLLVILISSQLTQSQFAHHQSISFLISMIFVSINTRSDDTSHDYNDKNL